MMKEAEAKKIKLPTIRALYDQDAAPPVTHILQRGDPLKPGDPVEPGIPSVLGDERALSRSRRRTGGQDYRSAKGVRRVDHTT